MAKVELNTEYPDRAVYFDQDQSHMCLAAGEKVYYTTRNVVDVRQTHTYSDVQKQGVLTVTNLRTIFHLETAPDTNLSIGYNTVTKILVGNIDNSQVQSKQTIIQQDRTLVLVCQDANRKYRFEFLPRGSRQIFDIVQSIYRAYDTSRAFRTTRTRQTLQNYLLPQEFVDVSHKDVSLFSQLSTKLVAGVLQFTTYRMVWYSPSSPHFNVLVPYLDIKSIQIQKIKVEDQEMDYVYIMTQEPENGQQSFCLAFHGFAIPVETLYDEVVVRTNTFRQERNIYYGVSVTTEDEHESLMQKEQQGMFQQLKQQQTPDNDFLLKKHIKNINRVFDYVQQQKIITEIELDEQLGLAFEKCQEGVKKEDLWGI